MADQTTGLYGVALITGEGPAHLRVALANIPPADLPRVRDAVDQARADAADAAGAPHADRVGVTVAWGRHGRKPLLEALAVPAAAVAELRSLLLELDR